MLTIYPAKVGKGAPILDKKVVSILHQPEADELP